MSLPFIGRPNRRRPGGFDAGAVAATVSENFGTLLPYADALGARELAAAHRFAVAFLHARHEQLEDRATRGFVRDCHGDLRAEHVILEGDSVEVFDPVEFDPALRRIDVSADLAFLVMDLVAAGADDLAGTLISEYESAGGDHGGRSLLFFYAAYRAWVRAKVACLRAGELAPAERARPLTEARHFAELGAAACVARAEAARDRDLRRVGNRQDSPGRARGLAVRAPAYQLRRGAQAARRAGARAARRPRASTPRT